MAGEIEGDRCGGVVSSAESKAFFDERIRGGLKERDGRESSGL